MRVLVEQTRDVVADVVARLGLATRIVVLMGGASTDGDWDTRAEDDAILIGTQDMLLSRALNRGYGMTRYRWPLHFGLLNNDALWIIDEVQLVGSGVATTAQLQALRRKLGTALPTRTSWMSATMDERWLRTVDVEDADLGGRLVLEADDHAHPVVAKRIGALKAASRARAALGDVKDLTKEVLEHHRAGTRTVVILNTVVRAQELFTALRKQKSSPPTVLLHSRFRPAERRAALDRALAAPGPDGTIVVSTQVIEAGVDLTSTTMFSEIAPWSSMVQRFGRCNRGGSDAGARVFWISLPTDEKTRAKLAPPYELAALAASQEVLQDLTEVGPQALPKIPMALDRGLVLRRRDLLDLFDTTPDLMGNDVDVSRFIRDADDHDLRVCWRDFDGEPSEASPRRDELCAVPIGVVREWQKAGRAMWHWDALAGRWVSPQRVYPGLTLIVRGADGGYDPSTGLDPKGTRPVSPVPAPPGETPREEDRQYEGDPESEWKRWYTLAAHSVDVAGESDAIASAVALPGPLHAALVTAGRWHDAGKAHPVWQDAAKRLGTNPPTALVAKSQAQKGRLTYEGRRGFRHELASALLALAHGQSDLVCFLIACHHGKVRLSLRSLPTEDRPKGPDGREDPSMLHARGVWDGDVLPSVDLGGGMQVPPTRLTLSYMVLGDDPVTGRSWLARTLALRDDPDLGPFRLGYLEALIKCADERASARTQETV